MVDGQDRDTTGEKEGRKDEMFAYKYDGDNQREGKETKERLHVRRNLWEIMKRSTRVSLVPAGRCCLLRKI